MNREKAPDDFHPQVVRCLQLLEAMGIPILGVEGAEADDVIATLATRLESDQPELNMTVISAGPTDLPLILAAAHFQISIIRMAFEPHP